MPRPFNNWDDFTEPVYDWDPSGPRRRIPRPPPKTPLQRLAEAIKEIDDDKELIQMLCKEIGQIAQMVHQAYHGASGPDADHGTWDTCSRGICKRAQDVIEECIRKQRHAG